MVITIVDNERPDALEALFQPSLGMESAGGIHEIT